MIKQGESYNGVSVEIEVIENGYLVHYRGAAKDETAAYHTLEDALAKVVEVSHSVNVGKRPQVIVTYVDGYLK